MFLEVPFIIKVKKETINTLEGKIRELKEQITELKQQIVELKETALLQNLGLYEPMYNFATVDEYKTQLKYVRDCQKKMIKNNTAVICSTSWCINGNANRGKKWTANNIKQTLLTL